MPAQVLRRLPSRSEDCHLKGGPPPYRRFRWSWLRPRSTSWTSCRPLHSLTKAMTVLESAAILSKPVQIDREFHLAAEVSKPLVRRPGRYQAQPLAYGRRDTLARCLSGLCQEVGWHVNGDLLPRFRCHPRTIALAVDQSGNSSQHSWRACWLARRSQCPSPPNMDTAAGRRPCSRTLAQSV